MALPTGLDLKLLRNPRVKPQLALLLEREIKAADARKEAAASEAQFRTEQGTALSQEAEMARCRDDILHWVDQWVWTFDPRLIGKPGGAYIRFKPWPKQAEMLLWLKARFEANEPGLVEKSRDQGATYLLMIFFLHRWLFFDGFKASMTSMSEDKVDSLSNADSMFEKLRIMLRRLPRWMMPPGFSWHHHDLFMRLINPANGSVITGEVGDNAGRSGRSAIFGTDEAAFIARPTQLEAALSGNTECVIWMSTVNPQGGVGNFFARKRHSDSFRPDQIFVLDWRDDPRKDAAWASAKKLSLSDPMIWEAEFERNYTAAAEGICIPAAWVAASQRLAGLEKRLKVGRRRIAGVDVGAGKAKSVYVDRAGAIVGTPFSRGDPDTTGTAHWALDLAKTRQVAVLNYDAQGPGIGVTSTFANVDREGLTIVPVTTGNPPTERVWPDERTSQEMFVNLRAELCWMARMRFQRTYEHVRWLEGEPDGVEHPVEELIALPPSKGEGAKLASQCSLLKWSKNERGKILIESKEALKKRGIPSPDYFDAFVNTLLEPDDEEKDGIFKRPWFRMWPAFAKEKEPRPLPEFQFVLIALRTAFDDERRLEHRVQEATACGVYGVFNVAQQFPDEKERRAFGIILPTSGPKVPRYAALLCDFWYEKLSFADVADRVREQSRQKWGPRGTGKRPDVVLVEEATSDRSMRQTLSAWQVPAWPLATDQSPTMRAHQSAGFVQQGAIFVPESRRPERAGFICDWAEPMVKQACSYTGRGAPESVGGVHQLTAAILYLSQRDTIKAVPLRRALPDPDEEEERSQKAAMLEHDREKRRGGSWYGA